MASFLRTFPCSRPRVCLPCFSSLCPIPGLPQLHLSLSRLPPLKGGVLFPFFPQFPSSSSLISIVTHLEHPILCTLLPCLPPLSHLFPSPLPLPHHHRTFLPLLSPMTPLSPAPCKPPPPGALQRTRITPSIPRSTLLGLISPTMWFNVSKSRCLLVRGQPSWPKPRYSSNAF